ncbi:MAG: alpha/beta hydrolase [Acidobacteria bacterium]|nr:MAG: alpha/beta hydrolase [Acidobacteriota bacterium]
MTAAADTDAIAPPSRLWLLLEGRALGEFLSGWAAQPLLRRCPQGDGHPVMVLPGFVASDLSTRPLRGFLRRQGYAARRWGFGRNLGPDGGLEDRMVERLRYLRRVYDRKVSLIGWSLGGVYARELARRAPADVRRVITLGSPFRHPKANHSWRLFEWLSGMAVDELEPERLARMAEPPPVPSTAIYSRTDGVTNWRCCVEQEAPQTENVAVPGSHCGLGVNPLALYVIADRLAQPEDGWRPFAPRGPLRLLYCRPAGG